MARLLDFERWTLSVYFCHLIPQISLHFLRLLIQEKCVYYMYGGNRKRIRSLFELEEQDQIYTVIICYEYVFATAQILTEYNTSI